MPANRFMISFASGRERGDVGKVWVGIGGVSNRGRFAYVQWRLAVRSGSVAVEEELAHLRETIEKLKAIKTPARIPGPTAAERAEVRMAIEHDQAAADLLRVVWMGEIGHSAEDIDTSLRHYRPQSAAEEQDLLDLVQKHLEWERTSDEALRTGT